MMTDHAHRATKRFGTPFKAIAAVLLATGIGAANLAWAAQDEDAKAAPAKAAAAKKASGDKESAAARKAAADKAAAEKKPGADKAAAKKTGADKAGADEDGGEAITFAKHIQPIFKESCINCHRAQPA